MSRFPKAVFIMTVCILVVASPALRAYWVPDGVPLSTATGAQITPQAASDGAGGAIVVWYDSFSGSYDIFAQRVSASGNALWASDGVAVCTATSNQVAPVIVSDGAGGAIIAWYDGRSGNDDIYAQRVNASGIAQWTANGVALCTATGSQQGLCIVSDGAGGAIVAWHDPRSGNLDIYAQRVNAFGAAQWTASGVPLCTAAGTQGDPKIVSDGAGGAICLWEDYRNGNFDIYAQRADVDGDARWTANGVPLCTTTDNQLDAVIAADGAGGAIVAWGDQRGASDNIYAQRVDASGAIQWAANGIAVYATTDNQSKPQIVSDGAFGAIVAWGETRKGFGFFAQRVNVSGSRKWQDGGVTLGEGLAGITGLYGSTDGAGGMIAAWYDSPGESYDIFAQRVSVSGALPWGSAQICVSAAIDHQMYPSVGPDGAGGAIVAWHDYRNGGGTDIYAQLVDRVGRTGWLAPDIASVHDVPGDQGGKVFLTWDAARADRFMDEAMSHYSIWRSIDATQAALAIEGGAPTIGSLAEFEPSSLAGDPVIRVEEMGALAIYWQLVDTHEALYMEGYGLPVATLFDSTAYCDNYHYFQVVAHTTDPRVFWKSAAAVGRSVDNLPPGAPAGLEGERNVAPFGLELTWDPNAESDFSCYALYRGLSADFVPGAANLVGQLDETGYFDGEWTWGAGYFYKLSAFDINGNESAFSLFSTDNITGDETPKAPAASYLAQNFPNPFNPTTRIAFGLSAAGAVSLRIYDAAGRLVRVLAEGARPAGNYSELWDGRDSGGRAVSSGIYFYRLQAGAFAETRKMALLR